jgi:hypothetical protein
MVATPNQMAHDSVSWRVLSPLLPTQLPAKVAKQKIMMASMNQSVTTGMMTSIGLARSICGREHPPFPARMCESTKAASYDRCPISQRTTIRTSPRRNPKSNSNSAAAVCACIPQVVIGVSVRNEETALA